MQVIESPVIQSTPATTEAPAKRKAAPKSKASTPAAPAAPATTEAPAVVVVPVIPTAGQSPELRPVDIVSAGRARTGLNDAIMGTADKGHVHPMFAAWLAEDYGMPVTAKARDFLQFVNRTLTGERISLTRDASKAAPKMGVYLLSDAAACKSGAKLVRLLHTFAETLAPRVKGAAPVAALPEWAKVKVKPAADTAAPATEAGAGEGEGEGTTEATASSKRKEKTPDVTAEFSAAANALHAMAKAGALTTQQKDAAITQVRALLDALETAMVV